MKIGKISVFLYSFLFFNLILYGSSFLFKNRVDASGALNMIDINEIAFESIAMKFIPFGENFYFGPMTVFMAMNCGLVMVLVRGHLW